MALLKKKLAATTLVEVLVAMLIILFCMSVSLVIYVNILNSDNHHQVLKARLLLKEVAHQTEQEQTFFQQHLERDGWVIDKKVQSYKGSDYLYRVSLKALNKQKEEIAAYEKIIYVE